MDTVAELQRPLQKIRNEMIARRATANRASPPAATSGQTERLGRPLETLQRTPKSSARYYAEVIKARRVV